MALPPPDYVGVRARAWRVPDDRERFPASVGSYLVNSDVYHPAWSWWFVAMVALRDEPGTPPAHLHYDGAEYEFMIASVDPDHNPTTMEAGMRISLLDPPDCVVQFAGVDDDGADDMLRTAVRAICAGQSPDSDYRRWWESAIRNGAQHKAMGGHPKARA